MKLAAKLPKHGDGLSMHSDRVLKYPAQPIIVVAILSAGQITTNLKTGEQEPTLVIDRIERVMTGDLDLAKTAIRAAYEHRAGFQDGRLPIELRDELDEVFDLAARDPRSVTDMAEDMARDLAERGVTVTFKSGRHAEQGTLEGDSALDPEDDDLTPAEALLRFGSGLVTPENAEAKAAEAQRRGSRAKRGKGEGAPDGDA